MARVAKGHEIKRIAADEELSMIGIRKMIWSEGWRSMHLSAEERAYITKRRAGCKGGKAKCR